MCRLIGPFSILYILILSYTHHCSCQNTFWELWLYVLRDRYFAHLDPIRSFVWSDDSFEFPYLAIIRSSINQLPNQEPLHLTSELPGAVSLISIYSSHYLLEYYRFGISSRKVLTIFYLPLALTHHSRVITYLWNLDNYDLIHFYFFCRNHSACLLLSETYFCFDTSSYHSLHTR